jgi:hypothetical protein
VTDKLTKCTLDNTPTGMLYIKITYEREAGDVNIFLQILTKLLDGNEKSTHSTGERKHEQFVC